MRHFLQGHTWRLECSMFAPVSIAEAFSIFENPYNLAAITPPWLRFRIVTPERIEMRKGAGIDYTIRWLGVPVRWRTLITGYDPPNSFVDEQMRGPYVLWRHLHTFEETQGGTLISDQVTYKLPFGILGNLAHALLIRRQLIGIFRYRQAAIAAMLSGGEPLAIRAGEPSVSVAA